MLLYIDLDVGRVAGLRTARRPNGRVAAGWTGTAGGPGPTAGPAAAAWSLGDGAVTTAVAQQGGSDPASLYYSIIKIVWNTCAVVLTKCHDLQSCIHLLTICNSTNFIKISLQQAILWYSEQHMWTLDTLLFSNVPLIHLVYMCFHWMTDCLNIITCCEYHITNINKKIYKSLSLTNSRLHKF